MTELITIETLSAKIEVSKSTLRKWCSDRRIPYVKFTNGTVRFDIKEVEKHIKDRTVKAKGIGQ